LAQSYFISAQRVVTNENMRYLLNTEAEIGI
jgi:hypothetical protein